MKQVDFYIVFDAEGFVVGDMDQEAARDRYNDEVGNDEFTVRKVVFHVPEAERIEVTMPISEAAVAVT
jgi:hypothetical protein